VFGPSQIDDLGMLFAVIKETRPHKLVERLAATAVTALESCSRQPTQAQLSTHSILRRTRPSLQLPVPSSSDSFETIASIAERTASLAMDSADADSMSAGHS
jgi:hypothetical protein